MRPSQRATVVRRSSSARLRTVSQRGCDEVRALTGKFDTDHHRDDVARNVRPVPVRDEVEREVPPRPPHKALNVGRDSRNDVGNAPGLATMQAPAPPEQAMRTRTCRRTARKSERAGDSDDESLELARTGHVPYATDSLQGTPLCACRTHRAPRPASWPWAWLGAASAPWPRRTTASPSSSPPIPRSKTPFAPTPRRPRRPNTPARPASSASLRATAGNC